MISAHLWVFSILFVGFAASFFIVYLVYCDTDKKNTILKKRIVSSMLYRMNEAQFHSHYLMNSRGKKQSSFEKKHQNKSIVNKLNLLLVRANVKVDLSALVMIFLGLCGMVFSFLILNQKGILVSFLISLSISIVLPYKILTYLADKRKKSFDKVFSDALDIMVRSIKAGFSVNRAISLIAKEGLSPVKEEFQIITDHLSAGQSLEATLLHACERIDLPNFRFFAVCILIQSETGGNLSDALSTLIQVIRKRQEIGLKIKALSSEARASAMIVGSLPFLAAIALSIFNPAHMAVFYNTASGQKWIMIMGGLLMTGILTIRKLIRFKI